MKQTLNVNIGSVAFTIDLDAYELLKDYLDDIGERLSDDERPEILGDVEARVADIFGEQLTVSGQVVDAPMVRRAIAVIGRADCFGERLGCPPPRYSAPQPQHPRKFYRSKERAVIGGLCAGLAEYMDWDLAVVRLVTVLLVFFGGLSIWVYIILWIIIPREPSEPIDISYYKRKNERDLR